MPNQTHVNVHLILCDEYSLYCDMKQRLKNSLDLQFNNRPIRREQICECGISKQLLLQADHSHVEMSDSSMECSVADRVAATFGLILKKEQRLAISALLEMKDVFVSLPTGYGKSLIYFILPLCHEKVSAFMLSCLQLCL